MLRFYERIARALRPARPLLWAVAATALAGFLAVLFVVPSAHDTGWMLLAAMLLLWAVGLLLVVNAFARPAPVSMPGDRLLARVGKWLVRVARWFIALAMTVLAVAALWLSMRAVRVLLGTLGG